MKHLYDIIILGHIITAIYYSVKTKYDIAEGYIQAAMLMMVVYLYYKSNV